MSAVSPLARAVRHNDLEKARRLLESGAAVEEGRSVALDGATPLAIASFYGFAEMAALLLDFGANVNNVFGGRAVHGGTALYFAAQARMLSTPDLSLLTAPR